MKTSRNFVEDLIIPIKHKELFKQLIIREIQQRYRGSVLGSMWAFLNPFFLLSTYTIVFSVVFEARWGREVENRSEFAVIFFCGLIVYGALAEIINVSPNIIRNNQNLVKKVVFPLELLTWVTVTNALFHALVSLIILFVMRAGIEFISVWPNMANFRFDNVIPLTAILLPIIWLPLIGWSLAAGWLLSALGVFLKDISQFFSRK